ncbi:MAG: hypothetical protein KUG67_02225 [Proteobacteria bacterium]|nr:hypothetical protein [Pseudomonadota bacterium]
MKSDSNHQQYLKKLGIESWVRRVDSSFFPLAPDNSNSINDCADKNPEPIDYPVAELAPASAGSPAIDIDLQVEKITPGPQFNCCIELTNDCLVVIETDRFEEPLPSDQYRLLKGVLRSIGVTELTETNISYFNGAGEIQSLLSGSTSRAGVLLFFGARNTVDLIGSSAYAEKIWLAESLQKILCSAETKKSLWLKLKSTQFVGLSTG